MRFTVTVLAVIWALAGAGAAQAAVAPGLVTTAVPGEPAMRHSVDPFVVGTSAPLPSGGLVTAGISGKRLVLARFRSDGSLDPAFGKAGVARLTVPADPSMVGPFPGRVLPMADGRLVVVTRGPAASRFEFNRAVVTRVLADGRLDSSFGSSGSVLTPIQTAVASLQPDGKTVLTGTTGAPPQPLESGFTGGTLEWTTMRLDTNGAVDNTFGGDGSVTLDLAGAGGLDSAPLPAGRVAVTGTHAGAVVMLALRPDGIVDPSFNGGVPLPLAGAAAPMGGLIARPDGALHVASVNHDARTATVQRVRPDGSFDPTFGSGGATHVSYCPLGTGIAPAPDGSIVAFCNLVRGVNVTRLSSDGKHDPAWGGTAGREIAPALGGGYADAPSLRQSGFWFHGLSARPGGGLLVAGTVAVIQGTGEGLGNLHEEIAVAAYRPDLSPDPAWGGPVAPARLSITAPPQRARTVARRDYPRILLVANTSGPGLVRVSVRARGRTVALATAPAYRSGSGQVLLADLTRAGRRMLARARNVPISVTATFRDFVRSEARASARGRLR